MSKPYLLITTILNWIGLFWFPFNLIHTINNVNDYWGWVFTLLSASFLGTKYKKWMDED